MYNTTNIQIRLILLLGFTALMLSSCGEVVRPISPTKQSATAMPFINTPAKPSPSTAPPYIHFARSEAFSIYFEFDYPSAWIINKKRGVGIFFADPRFITLPTPSPVDFHPTPNDLGRVDIWVIPEKPGQTLDTLVETHRQGYESRNWITPLSEYEIIIDGYDTTVFEDQIDFPELYTTLMFERNIFFIVNNQLYQITFSVAEKDRGGEFEKGFEYFFKSIKIVP
jgi:hypothetical protein